MVAWSHNRARWYGQNIIMVLFIKLSLMGKEMISIYLLDHKNECKHNLFVHN